MLLSRYTAEQALEEAGRSNPGPWVSHSRYVALACRNIAARCPKLDAVDYAEKLTAIFAAHSIRSVTVARMEVPCCGGIEQAVQRAIAASGKAISCHVTVIGTDGTIQEER